jgi:flavin-dependent dehydrogenase
VLDGWSNARIALIGDAASSVSLFGGGSSLAMVAAFTLAEQLAEDPGNPRKRSLATRAGIVASSSRGSATSDWLQRFSFLQPAKESSSGTSPRTSGRSRLPPAGYGDPGR